MRRLLLYLILFISGIFLVAAVVLYFIDGSIDVEISPLSMEGNARKVNYMAEDLPTNMAWNPLVDTELKRSSRDLLEFNNKEYGDIEVSNISANHFKNLYQYYKIIFFVPIHFTVETIYTNRGTMTDVELKIKGEMPFILKWYAGTFNTDITHTFEVYLTALKNATKKAPDNIALPSTLENLVLTTESKRVIVGIKTELFDNETVNNNLESKQLNELDIILKSQKDTLLNIGNPAKIKLKDSESSTLWLIGKNVNKTIKQSRGTSYYSLPERVVKITHKGDPKMIQNAMDSINKYCEKKALETIGAPWFESFASNESLVIDSVRIVVHQPIK